MDPDATHRPGQARLLEHPSPRAGETRRLLRDLDTTGLRAARAWTTAFAAATAAAARRPDPSRRWGIRLDTTAGPWLSLGIHLDFRAPLVDLHLPWLIVSVGRVYAGGRWQARLG